MPIKHHITCDGQRLPPLRAAPELDQSPTHIIVGTAHIFIGTAHICIRTARSFGHPTQGASRRVGGAGRVSRVTRIIGGGQSALCANSILTASFVTHAPTLHLGQHQSRLTGVKI